MWRAQPAVCIPLSPSGPHYAYRQIPLKTESNKNNLGRHQNQDGCFPVVRISPTLRHCCHSLGLAGSSSYGPRVDSSGPKPESFTADQKKAPHRAAVEFSTDRNRERETQTEGCEQQQRDLKSKLKYQRRRNASPHFSFGVTDEGLSNFTSDVCGNNNKEAFSAHASHFFTI